MIGFLSTGIVAIFTTFFVHVALVYVYSSKSIGCIRLSNICSHLRPGTRFTKYVTTILRLSYDNAEVTIDLRRTSDIYLFYVYADV